jgi:sugar phosphate isomerase/epimerase
MAIFGQEIGVVVGIEAVNRFSGCLINTAETALKFVEQIGSKNIKIVLDTFHMNIEESDPLRALRRVQGQLIHLHIGNNNRRGVGKGQMDYIPYIRTLKEIGYNGTIGMEIMAPGPDPQVPIKDEHSEGILENDLEESLKLLRFYEEIV